MSMADVLRVSAWQAIADDLDMGALESMTSVAVITLNAYVGDSVLNFSSLASCSSRILITVAPAVTAINFPVMTALGGNIVQFDASPVLTTLSLPVVIFGNPVVSLSATGCALSAASVAGLLARCVASGLTTATIQMQGGTNAGLASLSAQGQADYAALTTAGNTVILNP